MIAEEKKQAILRQAERVLSLTETIAELIQDGYSMFNKLMADEKKDLENMPEFKTIEEKIDKIIYGINTLVDPPKPNTEKKFCDICHASGNFETNADILCVTCKIYETLKQKIHEKENICGNEAAKESNNNSSETEKSS